MTPEVRDVLLADLCGGRCRSWERIAVAGGVIKVVLICRSFRKVAEV
jgi:hypothetical protein